MENNFKKHSKIKIRNYLYRASFRTPQNSIKQKYKVMNICYRKMECKFYNSHQRVNIKFYINNIDNNNNNITNSISQIIIEIISYKYYNNTFAMINRF